MQIVELKDVKIEMFSMTFFMFVKFKYVFFYCLHLFVELVSSGNLGERSEPDVSKRAFK